MADVDVGRCSTCGFLAKHGKRWHEATEKDRQSGDFTEHDDPSPTDAACFRGLADLRAEMSAAYKGQWVAGENQANLERGRATAKAVVGRDRQCPSWFRYAPGFTPQEHSVAEAEMHLASKVDSHESRNLRISKWTLVVAILALVVVVLTYLFPDTGKHIGEHLAAWWSQITSPPPGLKR